MKSCMISGSFDPITAGHADLIARAAKLFDRVFVTLLTNSDKKYFFSDDFRMELIRRTCKSIPGAEAARGEGLTADFAAEHGISVIVKGVRNSRDFEWEADMSRINSELAPGTETVLLCADPSLAYISSTFVREVIRYGRDPSPYLPVGCGEFMLEYLARNKSAENNS